VSAVRPRKRLRSRALAALWTIVLAGAIGAGFVARRFMASEQPAVIVVAPPKTAIDAAAVPRTARTAALPIALPPHRRSLAKSTRKKVVRKRADAAPLTPHDAAKERVRVDDLMPPV